MIAIEKVRDLVIEPLGEDRPAYIVSASGLVRIDNRVVIVADDEFHLAQFDLKSNQPGTWIKLLPGALASNYKERKKQKPDLETITHIHPGAHAADGALLVVPSMSRPNRITGAMLRLEKNVIVNESPVPIDFSDIQKKLAESINGLNVEGMAIAEKVTKIFHRGSKKKGKSVVIELDTKAFLHDLYDTHKPMSACIATLREYNLGEIDGVDLEFTDAVSMPDGRIIFLATAEATDDEYKDGASLGSALGIMAANGDIEQIIRITGREKFEGICANYVSIEPSKASTANNLELLLVSDTDNEKIPSNLYRASVSLN